MDQKEFSKTTELDLEKKKSKKWTRFFQLPERPVDVTNPFYFKVYNFKTDGVFFLLTSLILPLVILLIAYFVFPVLGISDETLKNSNLAKRQLMSQLGYVLSAVAGFIILNVRDYKLAYSSGSAFYFLPIFTNFLLAVILGLAISQVKDELVRNYLNLSLNIVQAIVWIVLFFVYVPSIGPRMKKTFKENWRMLLIVGIIAGGISFCLAGLLMPYLLQETVLGNSSDNQDSLNQFNQGIINAILLFIYTVLLAPLFEEIVYRNFYYTGVGNKAVAFFASAIMFALVHIFGSGDLEHILPYLVGGFCLSGVFIIARGNFTYSWLTHLVYNLITIIVMYCTNWVW